MGNNQDKTAGSFGRLLRFWRSVHHMSQEELAHALDSSPRHVSFLETGRALPRREMVQKIGQCFSLNTRDACTLMLTAGYVPKQPPLDFQDPALRWLRKIMTLTIKSLDPYPALVIGRHGHVHMVNRAWVAFHQQLLPAKALAPPLNWFHFLFSEERFRPFLVDWEDIACVCLLTLQQEIIIHQDKTAQELLKQLLNYTGIPENWQAQALQHEAMASFGIKIRMGDEVQPFYSVTQTFGSSGYIPEPRTQVNVLYTQSGEPVFGGKPLDLTGNLHHPLLFY